MKKISDCVSWLAPMVILGALIIGPVVVAVLAHNEERQRTEQHAAQYEAAHWIRLGSGTADVWILTTTYYCEDQTGPLGCDPGRQHIVVTRKLGDAFASAKDCEDAAAEERDADAEERKIESELERFHYLVRAKVNGSEYVLPGELVPPLANPHFTCARRPMILPGEAQP